MIPKVFHYIWLNGPKTPEFGLSHFFSIESNRIVNKPEKIFFWTNKSPESEWFDKIKDKLTIVPTELAYGLDMEMAHQADILRFQILRDYGGVYSDLDSIATNKLPNWVWNSNLPITAPEIENGKIVGICVGFMLSPINSKWMNLRLLPYKHYDPAKEWGYYSTQTAIEDFNANPGILDLWDMQTFYPFNYGLDAFKDLFLHDEPHMLEGSYQVHLWDYMWYKKILREMTMKHILTVNTTFTRLIRKYV